MISNGFAQLGEFIRDTEKYSLEAFYHLNPESVVVGQKIKLFIRPKLILNSRTISVKSLKSSTLEVIINDQRGKEVVLEKKDP